MNLARLSDEELVAEFKIDHDLSDQFAIKRELIKRFKEKIDMQLHVNVLCLCGKTLDAVQNNSARGIHVEVTPCPDCCAKAIKVGYQERAKLDENDKRAKSLFDPAEIEGLREKVKEQLDAIYKQREELVTAFIAKYGCGPEEAEIVQEMVPGGGMWKFSIRKKGDNPKMRIAICSLDYGRIPNKGWTTFRW